MAKIVRKVMKVFGSASGPSEVAQFGSLANSLPIFTLDPAVIQGLSQYLSGWFAAVIGGNSPAIEDMNALCYLFAYQLTYLMQTGVPEWDAGQIYFIGSMVNDGFGNEYASNIDNNTNPLTGNGWTPVGGISVKSPPSTSVIVRTGQNCLIPDLVTAAASIWTVQSGASLYSFHSITVGAGGTVTMQPGSTGGLL